MADPDAVLLADSILKNSAPAIARDYVALVLGSDDPEDKRKYFELMAKREAAKRDTIAGAVMHVTFDFGANGVTIQAQPVPDAEVVEADDARPADAPQLPAPEDDPVAMFDMSDLLLEPDTMPTVT